MRKLFSTFFCKALIFIGLSEHVSAQNCSPLSVSFPDTVCLGQTVQGTNSGAQAWSYKWDVGGGDLFRSPTLSAVPVTGVTGSMSGIHIEKFGDKYLGFLTSAASSSLIRLDFDTNLMATPTVTNLGNIGNALALPYNFKLVKEGNNYYGFTVNRNTSTVVRLSFGTDLMATPTATAITTTGMGSSFCLDVVKEQDNYFVLFPSYTTSKMAVLAFGNNLGGTPTFTSYNIPAGTYSGIASIENCQGKFVLLTDAFTTAPKIQRLRFATSFGQNNPTLSTIAATGIQRPGPMVLAQDGGRIVALVGGFTSASGLSMANFGGNIESTPVLSSVVSGSPAAVLSLSPVFSLPNGNSVGFYTTDGGVLGRINFPNVNISYSGGLSGYQPPVLSFSSAGKYFVNYSATDGSGNIFYGGDSIVVRSATGTGLVSMNFEADEQCPLPRTTKFYPSLEPISGFTYKWTYHDGSTSTQAVGSKQYGTAGNYLVTMFARAINGCGSGSVAKTVKIFGTPGNVPSSNFTVPAQVCTKDTVLFTDQSTWPGNTIRRWKWEFGPGNVIFTQHAKSYFQTNQAGTTIQVSLTASDSSGCGTPVTKPVTPQAGADVQFTFNKQCKGEALEFQNTTTPVANVSFLWTFGEPSSGANNTSTSNLPTVTHQYADSGLYQVSLRGITQNGCSSNISRPVRVYPLPVAKFSVPAIAFPNVPLPFTNQSSGMYQVITGSEWNFGDPGSGVSNTSTLANPTHTYSEYGAYPVFLRVTSDKNCVGQSTKPVSIFPNCPNVSYIKSASLSGDYDTLILQNQTNLVRETRIDYCAGDLEKSPVMQSQQTGTPSILNGQQVVPIKDGNQWYGFIPCPAGTSNATSFFKATFGNSVNNDVSNFSTAIGNPQNLFSNPSFIRFFKEDSIWYGIAANGTKLYRLRFGTSLDNNGPVATEIPLPAGTLATPTGAQIVRDRDTTYIFITNNNNQINNNIIRLRFTGSLTDTASVLVYNNPPVLQNSTGFYGISFVRDCDNWYGLLLGNSQLYKLTFGFSLNNLPEIVSLTGEVTAGLASPNAFNNLRGVSLLNDMARPYALLNTKDGLLFRARFGGGLAQPIDNVASLGTLGITGTVGPFTFLQDGSEYFGLAINTVGVVFKVKFPNRCSASTAFSVQTEAGTDTVYYLEPGKYYITITGESPFGTITQRLDSVTIEPQSTSLSCRTTLINHPNEICYDYKLDASVVQPGLSNVQWDFCTGDFRLPPSVLASPVATTSAAAGGIQTVIENGNYYSFVAGANGLFRLNIGPSPDGAPGTPVAITLPVGGTIFGTLNDFRIFKEGNNWYGLCLYLVGESIVRLNFGPDITNTLPGYTIINLPGFLTKPRGLDIFEEFGNKYAIIANQENSNLVMLDFGKTYRNIPSASSVDVLQGINLYKVSMVKECNIWHAFVTDQAQDSLFKLSFVRGLKSSPVQSSINLVKCLGVKAIREGNRYYVFVTKVQTNFHNLIKLSYGNSLFNTPEIDSLGNFQVTTAATGLTNVIGFDIFRNNQSNHYFFGISNINASAPLYRVKFQNACSANRPTATGDTIHNQSYGADGKYYLTVSGYDILGNEYVGLDSVNVKNLVDAEFTIPGNRCKGEPILFADASTHGDFTTITSWKWNFGDPSTLADTSNNQNPTWPFTTAGTYPVSLTVAEAGGCINQLVRQITIADKPKPDFTIQTQPGGLICTNDSIRFTDASQTINDPISSRLWEVRKDNQLLFTSQRTNPQFLFAETGNYAVSLKITGESLCDSSITRTITVGAAGPVVGFTNGSACLNEPVPFASNIVGIAPDSIAWYIDNSRITSQAGFNYTFTTTNVYTVRLVAYNGGCANSSTQIVQVNVRPSFSISQQAPLNCQGLPINFSVNLSTAENVFYNWNFGDGTADSVKNPVKTFADSGTFKVKLVVTTQNGCNRADSVGFRAKPAPKAFFSFDKACKDEPVNFTNLSTANGIAGGITSYLWDFGTQQGLTSDQQFPGPVFYNENPGDKTVKLTVRTASECPNTYTKVISIGPKIAANFRKEIGCIGTPFKFFDMTNSGTDPIVSWDWNIGGLSYAVKNPIVEFDLKGIYGVRLRVVSQSGCIDEINLTDDFTVLDPAEADFRILDETFTQPPFLVRVEQLPAPSLSYDYTWDFGDNTTSNTATPPPHLYPEEGTYIITLTAVRSGTSGCSTKVQRAVNVVVNPSQGVKMKRISTAVLNGKMAVGVELENESNIALKTIDLALKAGNLVTLRETWTGILLPGATLSYNFKSSVLTNQSQPIVYLCGTASLADPSKEITPENNALCLTLDTVPSLVDIYPNPAEDQVTAELNLPLNDPIELRIVNALGQSVFDFTDNQPAIGVYRKRFDVSRLRPGLYTVWFRSASVVESKRLVVLKN